jgi:hypothetical protein
MFSKIPAISEIVVTLDQLYPVAFEQAQFIGAPSFEVVCGRMLVAVLEVSSTSVEACEQRIEA